MSEPNALEKYLELIDDPKILRHTTQPQVLALLDDLRTIAKQYREMEGLILKLTKQVNAHLCEREKIEEQLQQYKWRAKHWEQCCDIIKKQRPTMVAMDAMKQRIKELEEELKYKNEHYDELEKETKELVERIKELEDKLSQCKEELDRRRNLLEDVVSELDLSECEIEKHGPLGTKPAELVKLVLTGKARRAKELEAEHRIEHLEAQVEVWKDNNAAMKRERDNWRRTAGEVKEHVKELESQLKKAKETIQQEIELKKQMQQRESECCLTCDLCGILDVTRQMHICRHWKDQDGHPYTMPKDISCNAYKPRKKKVKKTVEGWVSKPGSRILWTSISEKKKATYLPATLTYEDEE